MQSNYVCVAIAGLEVDDKERMRRCVLVQSQRCASVNGSLAADTDVRGDSPISKHWRLAAFTPALSSHFTSHVSAYLAPAERLMAMPSLPA